MTAAVNDIGKHYRPVLILPIVHFKNRRLTRFPTATIGGAKSTGWPNERLCFECLKNFMACEVACKKDPVFLLNICGSVHHD